MILKKLLIPVLSSVVGISFLLYLSYSEYGYFPDFHNYLLAMIIGIINGFVVTFENKKLDNWISWKHKLGFRFVAGITLNFVTIIVITSIIVIPILFYASSTVLAANMVGVAIKFSILLFFGAVVYNTIYFAQYSYNQYAVTQIESIKNDRKQLRLQYEALKSQLSPHYLFNSLNTISSLVYKDANQAENFIRRLAQTYEYILSKNNHKFVLLSEEIEFVKSYNYLLQVRFENNVHLEIDVPDEFMSSTIPPLTLQMLVENAVKHNVITDKNPIYISVKMDDNFDLQVTNSKTDAIEEKVSFEIGLSNIRKRYSLLSDKNIKVDDGEQFTVTLPLLTSLNLESA